MTTVFDFLEEVHRRPTLYVGSDEAHRHEQLQALLFMLHGYASAVRAHRLAEPVRDFPREFMDYLRERFGWESSLGPMAAVRGAAASDEEAWALFWKLVREFRHHVESRSPSSQ